MLLSPSRIQFVGEVWQQPGRPEPHVVQTALERLLADAPGAGYPKLQVVRTRGRWYALNSGYLHVFRALEQRGQCRKAPVDIVPWHKLPPNLQDTLGSAAKSRQRRPRIYDIMNASTFELDRPASPSPTPPEEEESTSNVHFHKWSFWCSKRPSSTSPSSNSSTSSSTVLVSEMEQDSDQEDSWCTCAVCGHHFVHRRQLQRHRQIAHHYGCSICGKNCKDSGGLDDHRERLSHWSDVDDSEDDDEFTKYILGDLSDTSDSEDE